MILVAAFTNSPIIVEFMNAVMMELAQREENENEFTTKDRAFT